jgi:hypothetical protein
LDAILEGHLYCSSLALEKWSPSSSGDPESYIRYWLDDVYACVWGRRFNRRLLKWAAIDRWAMHVWCERHGIPLPDFWFPPGWGLEYKWPEETAPAHDESKPEPETNASGETGASLRMGDSPATSEDTTNRAEPGGGEEKRVLDWRLRAEIACQEVAKRYWKKHPTALLKEVAASPEVQDAAPGSDFEFEVVARWLGKVDPRDPAKRRGPKRRKI